MTTDGEAGAVDGRSQAIRVTVRSGPASGTSVTVDEGRVVLGRGDDCELSLPDPKVSRRHAAVEPLPDGGASLVDLGSGNGTFLNGQQVSSAVLEGNDQIQVGDTVLISSRGDLPEASGGTVIGASPGPERQSAIQRLVKRSTRRATIISGAAVAVAAGVGLLLTTGVIGGEGTDEAVRKVVKNAESSTVSIEIGGGGGTGWVLDAGAGLVVTNAHVIGGNQDVQVGVDGKLRNASLHAISPCEDLAVLRVAGPTGLETIQLGRQADLALGQTVVAVGYPKGASLEGDLTSTTGVVSVVKTAYRERSLDLPRFTNVIQTDAAINPGSSGGPLLDLDGRLVGVTSAGRTLTPEGRIVQGQNYAIGVDRVREVTDELRKGQSRGWTGAGFEYLTPAELRQRGLPAGILIEGAAPGSPADRAGLGGGDNLLVAVNGQQIDNSLASYCDVVRGLPAGKPLTFSVLEPGRSRPRDFRLSPG
jgi:S1-C subfamily serine protease